MSKNPWIKISDCPYSGKYLIYILENNQIMISDLQKFANAYTNKEAIASFQKYDLIHITEQSKPRKTTFISLTDKGQQVALKYKEIDDIEKGLKPEPQTNLSAPSE